MGYVQNAVPEFTEALHVFKAWAAIQDLLGGQDRIDEDASTWGDSFIVNLGTAELEGIEGMPHPRDLDNWHVDGDFFVSCLHYSRGRLPIDQ
jgi:hypothetical protein